MRPTPNSNTINIDGIAAEHEVPVGRVLYLRAQPGFPRTVQRKGRQSLFDREEVERFFRQQRHWVARC